DDTGTSKTDNLTTVNKPHFSGTSDANATIELLIGGTTVVGTGTADAQGKCTVQVTNALADGTYSFTAPAKANGNTSSQSGALSVTIDTAAPAVPSTPDLTDASDTAASNTDNITPRNTPTFTATAPANTTI